mmetsp:Transcript_36504/g.79935  ORF Transcript_36504/g.79935 Transcript_36504/m.79935 type:complete len:140 (+) Transcript_36504:33-452(+)
MHTAWLREPDPLLALNSVRCAGKASLILAGRNLPCDWAVSATMQPFCSVGPAIATQWPCYGSHCARWDDAPGSPYVGLPMRLRHCGLKRRRYRHLELSVAVAIRRLWVAHWLTPIILEVSVVVLGRRRSEEAKHATSIW